MENNAEHLREEKWLVTEPVEHIVVFWLVEVNIMDPNPMSVLELRKPWCDKCRYGVHLLKHNERKTRVDFWPLLTTRVMVARIQTYVQKLKAIVRLASYLQSIISWKYAGVELISQMPVDDEDQEGADSSNFSGRALALNLFKVIGKKVNCKFNPHFPIDSV